jgi:tetratricopeptide (TPR) repeat protein
MAEATISGVTAQRKRRGAAAGRSTPAPDRTRAATLWPMALVLAAGCAAYWNCFNLPLIWDDHTAIINNPTIRDLSWRALVPPTESPVAARPIVNATFAVNYALAGLDVIGYHAVNLAVHLGVALLLFAVVRRTLAGLKAEMATIIALFAALWWVVHPLTSESVDYVTQRTESMMALFLLLTIYAAIRALDNPRPRRWTAVAVLSCAAGMATKESMVVAPMLIVLYDRIFAFPNMREAVRARKALYIGLAATWIELAVLMWLQPHSTVGTGSGIGAWQYLMNQAELITRYGRLAFWPDSLVLDYGTPKAIGLREVLPQAAFMLMLVVATIAALVRRPALGFLGLVFFMTLAPTSSIVPIATEVGSERRMYLPLAALSILVAVAGWKAFERLVAGKSAEQRRTVGRMCAAVAAVWICALAVRTMARNAEYQTELSIWQTSLDRYPHGRARMSYATALLAAGQNERAVAELRLAVRDYPPAHYALGTELAALEQFDEAISELTIFIDDQPDKPDRIPARILLGRLFAARGRLEEARNQFETLVKLSPSMLEARASLGDVLVMQRKYDEAIPHYRAFLALRPGDARILVQLGQALASAGHIQEAVEAYQQAIQTEPRLAIARLHLGEIYLRLQKPEDAVVQATEAVRLEPQRADAHNLLGAALAASGKFAEAVEQFNKALELDPTNDDARRNLEHARLFMSARSKP